MWISKSKYNDMNNKLDKLINKLDIIDKQQVQLVKDVNKLKKYKKIDQATEIIDKLNDYLNQEYKSLQEEYVHTPEYEDRIEIVGARESIRNVRDFLKEKYKEVE